MKFSLKHKLAALVAVGALAIGGGAAYAATGSSSPSEESQAVVAAAAGDLGVTSAQLTAALKKALIARVDARLAAGEITQAQATAEKARINADDFPILGGFRGGHHGGPGAHVELGAAATFLGITETALRTQLESGKTLAEVATANGKTAAGLVAALVAAGKEELAQAVTDGRLTDARRDEIVAALEQRVTQFVNGNLGAGIRGLGFGLRGAPAVEAA